jgi:hypothetical protein
MGKSADAVLASSQFIEVLVPLAIADETIEAIGPSLSMAQLHGSTVSPHSARLGRRTIVYFKQPT